MALIDSGEATHESCRDAASSLSGPMLITWPVFTESMYLLGFAGWKAQKALWSLLQKQDLEIVELGEKTLDRTYELMEKYRDRPMALADATLVAVAEERGLRDIFTLDSDFDFYRFKGREHFNRIPA